MDLTHGDILDEDQALLRDVPMYINADRRLAPWSGCLHLQRDKGDKLAQRDYRIRLRDGRLGTIRVRKIISTNGAHHVEILFEGLGDLSKQS